MNLNNAVWLSTDFDSHTLPEKIIFTLNDDGTTYSVDCYLKSRINDIIKDVIVHSDSTSYPKATELFPYKNNDKECFFSITIPSD